jgi:hypothetical protein
MLVNKSVISTIKGKKRRVTWSQITSSKGCLFRERCASIDEYIEWVKSNSYSALLYDGSFFQITYDFDSDELVGHRLVYYPCPYDIDEQLLRTEGLLDVIQMCNQKDIRLRSPLRFDYDKDAFSESHPASHMTLLWEHCRWPVVTPLSLGHFVRFIFKHFYPNLWELHDFINRWPQKSYNSSITKHEQMMLHISCSRESRN